jgi:hypothetical protein
MSGAPSLPERARLRFVQREGGWGLVDDESRILSALRREVEPPALREFCAYLIATPPAVPEQFTEFCAYFLAHLR